MIKTCALLFFFALVTVSQANSLSRQPYTRSNGEDYSFYNQQQQGNPAVVSVDTQPRFGGYGLGQAGAGAGAAAGAGAGAGAGGYLGGHLGGHIGGHIGGYVGGHLGGHAGAAAGAGAAGGAGAYGVGGGYGR